MLLFIFFLLWNGGPGLQVTVSNVAEAKGQMFVSVYDRPETFLSEDRIRYPKIVPVNKTGDLSVLFADIPAGTYAIACFHDLNNNGKIDKNFLGVPTEPYGFSNNVRPTFKAPGWDDAKFVWTPGKTTIHIRLEK